MKNIIIGVLIGAFSMFIIGAGTQANKVDWYKYGYLCGAAAAREFYTDMPLNNPRKYLTENMNMAKQIQRDIAIMYSINNELVGNDSIRVVGFSPVVINRVVNDWDRIMSERGYK